MATRRFVGRLASEATPGTREISQSRVHKRAVKISPAVAPTQRIQTGVSQLTIGSGNCSRRRSNRSASKMGDGIGLIVGQMVGSTLWTGLLRRHRGKGSTFGA